MDDEIFYFKMDDKEIITKAVCDLPMIRRCEDNEKLVEVLKWVLEQKREQVLRKMIDKLSKEDAD